MKHICQAFGESHRLALALALALGLHAALLGLPSRDWSPHLLQPPRFTVTLRPPPQPPPLPTISTPLATEPANPPLAATPPPAPTPPQPSTLAPAPAAASARTSPSATLSPAKAKPPPQATTRSQAAKPRSVQTNPAPPRTTQAVSALAMPGRSPRPTRAAVKPVDAPPLPAESQPQPSLGKHEQPSSHPAIARPAHAKSSRETAQKAPSRLDSTTLLGQVAGLDVETQQRTSRSVREQRVNLADSHSLAGFYAADWARKVTRIGEINFPDAARRLAVSAGPLLEAVIRADGSLREVRVLRSSGHTELDQAAQRIVQLAAPYPPFSSDLRQQATVLRITAPWRFDPGGRVRLR
ncbi:MAG: TonB family protein [Candidatus Contendobacter sp.]